MLESMNTHEEILFHREDPQREAGEPNSGEQDGQKDAMNEPEPSYEIVQVNTVEDFFDVLKGHILTTQDPEIKKLSIIIS